MDYKFFSEFVADNHLESYSQPPLKNEDISPDNTGSSPALCFSDRREEEVCEGTRYAQMFLKYEMTSVG